MLKCPVFFLKEKALCILIGLGVSELHCLSNNNNSFCCYFPRMLSSCDDSFIFCHPSIHIFVKRTHSIVTLLLISDIL